MDAILDQYLDSAFLDWLMDMVPFVGAGLILGLIIAVLGWIFGLVWSLLRTDVI